MKIIDEEQKNINAIPGGCGDEYRKPPFLTASGDLSHHIEEIPKIFKVIDNNKLIKKEYNILGDYIFCYDKKLENDKVKIVHFKKDHESLMEIYDDHNVFILP